MRFLTRRFSDFVTCAPVSPAVALLGARGLTLLPLHAAGIPGVGGMRALAVWLPLGLLQKLPV